VLTYHHYLTSGAWDSSDTQNNVTVLATSPNSPVNGLVDAWKPMVQNVEITTPAVSGMMYNKEAMSSASIVVSSQVTDLTKIVSLDYAIHVLCKGITVTDLIKTYNIILSATCGSYTLYNTNPTYASLNSMVWATTQSSNLYLPKYQFTQRTNTSDNIYDASGAFFIPPPPATGEMELTINVLSLNGNTATDGHFNGGITVYQRFANSTVEDDLTYQTTVATTTDASYEIVEEFATADVEGSFCPQQILIYNGSAWVASAEWAVGTAAVSGYPILQLLTQEALYFQRRPRMTVEGEFKLTQHFSRYVIYWRSIYWMFLNGTYHAESAQWEGLWMQVTRQDSSTVTGSVNPYKDKLQLALKQINLQQQQIQNLAALVQSNVKDLEVIKKQNKDHASQLSYGVDGFITNNIEGLDGAGTGTKLTVKVKAKVGGWDIIAE